MSVAPTWKWEINLNTLVILFGFMAGVGAWGMTWQKAVQGQQDNTTRIDKLEVRMTLLDGVVRQLDNHELRISSNERRLNETNISMRSIETTLSNLSADTRIMKEILTRLEAQREQQPSRPK